VKALFDENLSPRLAAAVAALSDRSMPTVVHLRDRFPAGTTDATWMTALGSEGRWILVSNGLRIRRRDEKANVFEPRLTISSQTNGADCPSRKSRKTQSKCCNSSLPPIITTKGRSCSAALRLSIESV
jgi:hypothetical protein